MRVALCSKEGLFGEALASLLDHQGSFQVVATEQSPKDLINAAKEYRAQVMVVDSFELDRNELQFLMGARAFGDFGIVLIVGEEEKAEFVEVPVDRIVSRATGAPELFAALEELGGSVRLTSRPFVREVRRTYGNGNDLTRREYEVAQLVAKGMSNRKISQVTGLREQSIKNLVSVVMRKLHCENRVQVALKLTRAGAMDVSEE
ncbi:response regulator transcription factor [Fimbriimonas ginsengisoli]|uniref:LuxR family two component transcriptional regulator n=1 Tax=Fimbriimonas ginsengisoli Gsoil 348 TaxID=661478 RepID=A0A068NP92_FIMGI|nr:response regulator transcription factor [Fimbriimonas ginsengisoli]AIE85192.1 LuxR family two component transcriptional regulator [Fimbriimonas ginsengisoli Gsoil 348]